MKGNILDFSIQQGVGVIAAEDGNRYEFSGQQWKEQAAPQKGMYVDFAIEPTTGNAVSIYLALQTQTPFTPKIDNPEEQYTIIDWTKKCFENYANFSGRARRKEFWLFYLALIIVGIVAQIIDILIHSNMGIVNLLWNLATFIPILAAGARRLHDTGRSGWWQLLVFTIIGIIPLVIFWASDTKQENNKWGQPAK